MAKRIMHEFRIDEISAVDRPAQKHARMVLMKRDFTTEERDNAAKAGEAMPDGSYPIKDKADLGNAVQSYGRAKDKAKVKAHIIRRAKALDAVDSLPEDWNVGKIEKAVGAIAAETGKPGARSFADILAENEECRREWEANERLWPLFSALQASIQSIAADADKDTAAKTDMIRASVDDFLAAVSDAVPDVEAELEKALIKAGDGLHLVNKGDPSMTDTSKVADLERQVAELTKALDAEKAKVVDLTKAADIAKNDESFEADGQTIRKSDVGENAFKFMKAQAEKIAMNDFAKKAEVDLPYLPGETVAKAQVLRHIAKLDADVAKTLNAMLAAGNAAMKAGMVEKGHGIGGFTKAEDELNALVEAHVAAKNVSKAAAYEAVLNTADGKRLYAEMDQEKKRAA